LFSAKIKIHYSNLDRDGAHNHFTLGALNCNHFVILIVESGARSLS
jgi:hypothetical protein